MDKDVDLYINWISLDVAQSRNELITVGIEVEVIIDGYSDSVRISPDYESANELVDFCWEDAYIEAAKEFEMLHQFTINEDLEMDMRLDFDRVFKERSSAEIIFAADEALSHEYY